MMAAIAIGVSLGAASEEDLVGMALVHRAAYGPRHFLALLPVATLVEYHRLFLNGGSRAIIVGRRDRVRRVRGEHRATHRPVQAQSADGHPPHSADAPASRSAQGGARNHGQQRGDAA